MDETATAPPCLVKDCQRLSALTDVSTGQFWRFEGHYCSECYTALLQGYRPEIDIARLVLRPVDLVPLEKA